MVDLFFRSFDELYTGDIFFFFAPFCEHGRWEFFGGDSCDTWCLLIGANGKGEEEVDI